MAKLQYAGPIDIVEVLTKEIIQSYVGEERYVIYENAAGSPEAFLKEAQKYSVIFTDDNGIAHVYFGEKNE